MKRAQRILYAKIANRTTAMAACVNALDNAVNRKGKEVASAKDIYDDLVELEKEMGEISYRHGIMSVRTKHIKFEGVELGQFDIRVNLSSMAGSQDSNPMMAEAVTPNCASTDDDVTHPHVCGGHVCMGDGGGAIFMALETGRIFDYFILIRAVLETYNPHGPYVSIDSWYEEDEEGYGECYECGCRAHEDEMYWCEDCNHNYCDECFNRCGICGHITCPRCAYRCKDCSKSLCEECGISCEDCGESLCEDCIHDCEACNSPVCCRCLTECGDCGTVMCKGCAEEHICDPEEVEKESDEDDEEQEQATIAGPEEETSNSSSPAVHPVCLEQAAVVP